MIFGYFFSVLSQLKWIKPIHCNVTDRREIKTIFFFTANRNTQLMQCEFVVNAFDFVCLDRCHRNEFSILNVEMSKFKYIFVYKVLLMKELGEAVRHVQIWTKSILAHRTDKIHIVTTIVGIKKMTDNDDKKKSTLLCIHITFNFVAFHSTLLHSVCFHSHLHIALVCAGTSTKFLQSKIETRLASFWLQNRSVYSHSTIYTPNMFRFEFSSIKVVFYLVIQYYIPLPCVCMCVSTCSQCGGKL